MKKNNCKSCPFRAKYDRTPKSVIGRIWHWHIDFCPGWKGYFKEQTPEKQVELRNMNVRKCPN